MAESQRCGACGNLYFPASKEEYDLRVCAKCRIVPVGTPAAAPPDSPEGINRQALEQAVMGMDKAVDAIYMNAMSISRLIGLAPDDIPRLCVMAGCRMVERMIETYLDRKAAADAGRIEWNLTDKARRQQEIHGAAADLIQTLSDGATMARQIQASLEVKVPTQ